MNDASQKEGTVNLTIRTDADCRVVCDGDNLFLINSNMIVNIKEKVHVGQHILQFVSNDYPEICIEKIVDFPEAEKNYLVIVNEFKEQIAEIKIKQKEEDEIIAAKKMHGWVDLGLSVTWATCNLGAPSPSDYGSYYAWGEIAPKKEYNWGSLRYCADDLGGTFTKYNTQSKYGNMDNKTLLELRDDAAHANWGGNWRMPTDAEWTELREKCSWKWTKQGGTGGYKVTSTINGKSIFLPAAGFMDGTVLHIRNVGGIYWSSSLNADLPQNAWYVHFWSEEVGRHFISRYSGYSVRPVTE